MKKVIFSALTLFFLTSLNAHAQKNAQIEADVLQGWNDVWQAYESNDEAKMWSYYADNACEVYPDGSMICGKKAIQEGYDAFKTMLEGTPSWKVGTPTVTILEPSLVLMTATIDTDIQLKGGQQIGGKAMFAVLLKKEKGNWQIVFDSQTPVLPMPGSSN